MGIHVKISFISIFLVFLVSKHDFVSFVDFTRIAASTQQIMPHIEYLLHSFAHFCSQNV